VNKAQASYIGILLSVSDYKQASRCRIGARIAEDKIPAVMQDLVLFHISTASRYHRKSFGVLPEFDHPCAIDDLNDVEEARRS
jgi:hypothetical protein